MSSKVKRDSLTYKDAGIDVAGAAALMRQLQHVRQRTHSTRVMGAGLFRLDFSEKLFARNYKDPVLLSATSRVGTKVKLAVQLKQVEGLGADVVGLTVNDLLMQGGEPLFFMDSLAFHRLEPGLMTALVQSIATGCVEAGCSLLNGNAAEMPTVYGVGEFDVAGFAVGVVDRSKLLDGADVEVGDSVIGLASSGLHANGYTLVQRIVEKTTGSKAEGVTLTEYVPELHGTLAEELLKPTRIYAKAVHGLLGKYKVKKVIKAMAHVANGGLAGVFPSLLPEGFSVRLKRDAWAVPPIFQWLQGHGPVEEEEMLRVFNMGIGYVLIVRPTFTKPMMTHLRTLGERPYFLGKVRKGSGEPRVEWS